MILVPKLKNSILICFLVSLFCHAVQGQSLAYQHDLSGVTDKWQVVPLTPEILDKVKTNLADLRILSISKAKDTTEVPFIVEKLLEERVKTAHSIDIINPVQKGGAYYFTIKLKKQAVINEINLDFVNENYNWLIDLKGSQNQKEWFTILEDYRILSIKNEWTRYSFNKLSFPKTEYVYYQLEVKSEEKPNLSTAAVNYVDTISGRYNTYPHRFNSKEDKKLKQSIVEIDLQKRLPISMLDLAIASKVDFQRAITIEFLTDSIKTPKGDWRLNYNTLTNTHLSSLEPHHISFREVFTSKLKLIIHNRDDQPLTVQGAVVKGPQYRLVGRFDQASNQFLLVYGAAFQQAPRYDIANFKNTIPKELKPIQIGKVQVIESKVAEESPLFENQVWLWAIMLAIILVLGWFTLQMMKKTASN